MNVPPRSNKVSAETAAWLVHWKLRYTEETDEPWLDVYNKLTVPYEMLLSATPDVFRYFSARCAPYGRIKYQDGPPNPIHTIRLMTATLPRLTITWRPLYPQEWSAQRSAFGHIEPREETFTELYEAQAAIRRWVAELETST